MTIDQFFKRYQQVVVIDTEFTTWEGAPERNWSGENEHREIIQISALKVDLLHDQILDSFNRFVKPRVNPELSDFAKKLTGISQAQVNTGQDFYDMYLDLLEWSNMLPLCSYTPWVEVEAEGVIFKENIDLYQLDVPYYPERFTNLVPFFKAAGVDTKQYSSGTLYQAFDLELPGHVHNAEHDVNSLAESLFALKEEKVFSWRANIEHS